MNFLIFEVVFDRKTSLKRDHFNRELENDLFGQLFSQILNVTTHNLFDDSDDNQTFVLNQLKKSFNSDSDLTFSLVSIKRTLLAKNEENFAKLSIF